MGRLPAAIALRGLGSTEDREDRRGVARGVEVLEVQPIVPGLLVVELLKLLRTDLELDRDHGRGCDEHGIHPPAEPRDIELKVNPGGGGGEIGRLSRMVGSEVRESCAEHGKLKLPCGELLRGERVAVRGGKRRVGLLVACGKKRFDGRGIEGGIEAGGPTWRPGYHTEGDNHCPGAGDRRCFLEMLDTRMYGRILS